MAEARHDGADGKRGPGWHSVDLASRDECKVLCEGVGAYKYLVLVIVTMWSTSGMEEKRMCKHAPVWEPESSELPSRRSKGQQGRKLLKGKTK